MARNEQFKLHAYICGNACMQHVDVDGTLSFMMLFMRRPAECRYAVVSHYNVAQHADEVLVFDLYEAQENLKTGALVAPEPMFRGDCVDAAVMQTFMTYRDD
jgi:hypothetical protein